MERAAGPDADEPTVSLLNFVNIASSNIKLALDRPAKSKRKVNHRKYLQKQLKRCESSPNRSTDCPSPSLSDCERMVTVINAPRSTCSPSSKSNRKETAQIGLQQKSLQALFDPRTLHARCCADPNSRGHHGSSKVPLRKRNLPASFFTEPAINKKQCDSEEHNSVVMTLLDDSPPPSLVLSYAHSISDIVPQTGYQQLLSPQEEHQTYTVQYPADSLETLLGHSEFSDILVPVCSNNWQEDNRSSSSSTPTYGNSLEPCSPHSAYSDLSEPLSNSPPLHHETPVETMWGSCYNPVPPTSDNYLYTTDITQTDNNYSSYPDGDPTQGNTAYSNYPCANKYETPYQDDVAERFAINENGNNLPNFQNVFCSNAASVHRYSTMNPSSWHDEQQQQPICYSYA